MKAIGYDINWVTTINQIPIHALSGGGRLPVTIDDMDESDLDQLVAQTLSNAQNCEIEINPNLPKFINVSEKQAKAIIDSFKPVKTNDTPIQQYINRFYSRQFVKFAKKGFIAFDKSNLHDPNDCHYHIVAYPKQHTTSIVKKDESIISFEEMLTMQIDLSQFIDFAELQ